MERTSTAGHAIRSLYMPKMFRPDCWLCTDIVCYSESIYSAIHGIPCAALRSEICCLLHLFARAKRKTIIAHAAAAKQRKTKQQRPNRYKKKLNSNWKTLQSHRKHTICRMYTAIEIARWAIPGRPPSPDNGVYARLCEMKINRWRCI